MFKKIMLLIFTLIFLSACSAYTYREPSPPANRACNATIQGYMETASMFNWIHIMITTVDNQNVYYTFRSYLDKINVVPGKHHFMVVCKFDHSFSDPGPYEVVTEFDFVIKPGEHYRVRVFVEKPHIKLWIEDSCGKVVSTVYEGTY